MNERYLGSNGTKTEIDMDLGSGKLTRTEVDLP